MDFQVLLSREAVSDLERIVAYIAPHNAPAAERMGHQLLDVALSLKNLPERGRIVPEFHHPDLRELIFRSYRVIYRLNPAEKKVEIVRFWHAARGFPRIPRSGE